MGGFLLIRKDDTSATDETDTRYRCAISVFEKKGLSQAARLVNPHFVLYVYRKMLHEIPSVLLKENGDFIVSIGTGIYNGRMGIPALKALFDDYGSGQNVNEGLCGTYAILICHKGQLDILTDYAGYYPVYCTHDRSLVSSSFLAIAKSLDKKIISAHELYEYIFYGFFFHASTLLTDIGILDSRFRWRLAPTIAATPQSPEFEPLPASLSFEQAVTRIESDLLAYFKMLGIAFNKSIGSALSGGYDTRLMLAIMRKVGIEPVLHVYGSSRDSDVSVAKAIAAGEGLKLDHTDKAGKPVADPEEYRALIQNQFYFFDGLKSMGVFDNGSDLETRLERAAKALLQLNGAGGEIYREIWNVPDKSLSIRNFLQRRYDFADYSFCHDHFHKDDFFGQLVEKTKSILNIDGPRLSRQNMEMMFPFLRNKFAASNNSVNNQISPALLPFVEPRIIFPSFDIPIRWKYFGRFNAALCRSADPSIAAYMSGYRYNFQDPPTLARMLRTIAEMQAPLSLRILKRRRESRGMPLNRPLFLSSQYLDTIFSNRPLQVSEFVDLSAIRDPEQLSRALSVELTISDVF